MADVSRVLPEIEYMFKKENLGADLLAGTVVFLVALPLCLGMALASDMPVASGLIAGIVGGLIVGAMGGSQLSVSGPAAGLIIIVVGAVHTLGIPGFLLATFIAGLLQVVLGLFKAGIFAHFIPQSVIKGMLAATVSH
jgi:MFS superfamily sulfate permease-like transporter